MKTPEQIADDVAKRMEGIKVRVTYRARETTYYDTVIEAKSKDEADDIYYNKQDYGEPTGYGDFETYDFEVEEIGN